MFFSVAPKTICVGAVQEVLTTKAHRTCGSQAHEGNIDAKSNLYCPFVRLFRLRGKKFLLIGHLQLFILTERFFAFLPKNIYEKLFSLCNIGSFAFYRLFL